MNERLSNKDKKETMNDDILHPVWSLSWENACSQQHRINFFPCCNLVGEKYFTVKFKNLSDPFYKPPIGTVFSQLENNKTN